MSKRSRYLTCNGIDGLIVQVSKHFCVLMLSKMYLALFYSLCQKKMYVISSKYKQYLSSHESMSQLDMAQLFNNLHHFQLSPHTRAYFRSVFPCLSFRKLQISRILHVGYFKSYTGLSVIWTSTMPHTFSIGLATGNCEGYSIVVTLFSSFTPCTNISLS